MSASNESHPDFEEELRLAQVPVLSFLVRLCGNLPDAQDLMQQTNLTAWDKQAEFVSGTNFISWMCAIARNHYRNHASKQSRRPTVPLLDSDVEAMVENRHAEREQEEARKRKLLQVCLTQLPERHRTFVEDFYLHGRSLRDLADEHQIKVNAVAQLLHRARQNLIRCVRLKSHSELDSDTLF